MNKNIVHTIFTWILLLVDYDISPLKFEILTTMCGIISLSIGSERRICFFYHQNIKNIFQLLIFMVINC
jgi:hypothetical protein